MQKQKIIINKIFHNSESQDGQKFIGKNGKPYTRCVIFANNSQGIEGKLSGFGGEETRVWRAGDEVELLIEKKGEYTNFSVPPQKSFLQMIKELETRVSMLENGVTGTNTQMTQQNAPQANSKPPGTPLVKGDEGFIDVSEIPF